ncbi:MAG: type II secretion system F family protein [Oceanicaulis sp.]
MSPDIAFIAAAVCAFIAVAGVGLAFTGAGEPKTRKARLQAAVGAPAKAQPRRGASGPQDAQASKRKHIADSLKEIEDRQKAERKKSLTLRARIEQAGLDWSPAKFWIISGVLGAAAAVGTLVAGMNILLVVAAGAVAGLGMPRWLLGMMKARRLKKFTANFADALDVIVRGIKSGLPLNECLKIIAREGETPVKQEFQMLVEGIAVGVDADEGLRRMLRRVPLPELSFFSIVLSIQGKTGGNLAEALGNLSGVLRARKMMREKVGALSGEAKASAFIIGSLPPGVAAMVSVISPDYMAPLFTTSFGQLLLLGGGLWMLMGILVMRSMINFKM